MQNPAKALGFGGVFLWVRAVEGPAISMKREVRNVLTLEGPSRWDSLNILLWAWRPRVGRGCHSGARIPYTGAARRPVPLAVISRRWWPRSIHMPVLPRLLCNREWRWMRAGDMGSCRGRIDDVN